MISFVEPPFNYTGSKYGLLPQIAPLFDYSKERFVDLFAGGGSVYSNMIGKYEFVLANDIIADLIEVQHLLAGNPDETIAKTKALAVAKDDQEGYHKLRDSYNQTPDPYKLWALMCCCTNNMMRFNKQFKFNQTFGRRTFNDRTEAKARAFSDRIAPLDGSVCLRSGDFEQVKCEAGSMFFMDPPYSNTEAGYNCYWGKDDDLRLFRYCQGLDRMKASFAVSGTVSHGGKKCRLITMLLEAGFYRHDLKKDYNKVSRSGSKETQEVLICNYEPPKPDGDPFFDTMRED